MFIKKILLLFLLLGGDVLANPTLPMPPDDFICKILVQGAEMVVAIGAGCYVAYRAYSDMNEDVQKSRGRTKDVEAKLIELEQKNKKLYQKIKELDLKLSRQLENEC